MAERLILVGSGLVGLAVLWLFGYLARRQSRNADRGDWMGANPVGGAMGVGWLLTASLALITVGLAGLER